MEFLDTLTPTQRKFAKFRYGINGKQPLELAEIAQTLFMTMEEAKEMDATIVGLAASFVVKNEKAKKPKAKPKKAKKKVAGRVAKNHPSSICGINQEEIRTAFFTSAAAVGELLDRIQKNKSLTTQDVDELMAFLGLLEEERDHVRKTVGSKFNIKNPDELQPPSVDDLVSSVDPVALQAWIDKKDESIKAIKMIIARTTAAARKNSVNLQVLENWILEVEGLRGYLDQDRVHKDQLYRERLTRIITDFMCSRKEAEEWAKLTKEYMDYKLAVLFTENVDSWIMSAKKKLGKNF